MFNERKSQPYSNRTTFNIHRDYKQKYRFTASKFASYSRHPGMLENVVDVDSVRDTPGEAAGDEGGHPGAAITTLGR